MTPQDKGGIGGVTFPLIADVSKTVSHAFGVLGGDYSFNEKNELVFEGVAVALRATFLIDKQGMVRHEYINDNSVGRNIGETLRMVAAWQHFEKSGELCVADWEE
jgi:peroxiredoxin 2/4